jgi:amidase
VKTVIPLLITATLFAAQPQRQAAPALEETTIAQVHAFMKSGRLTCAALVDFYLERIEANDKAGAALNAITVLSPNARTEAAELDRRYKASGPVGPLHCVPAIVKDNFETAGLQTAAGSLALKDFDPQRDAFQVKRIK